MVDLKGTLHLTNPRITEMDVDAVVNSANSTLTSGEIPFDEIHKAAGLALQEACKAIGGCPVGRAVITPGFKLLSQYVIHVVGPKWSDGESNEEALLASAFNHALDLAIENEVRTIALPTICAGESGFPKEKAAEISLKSIKTFMSKDEQLTDVYIVCYDDENYSIYKNILGQEMVTHL